MRNHIYECVYGNNIDCPLQSCNVKTSAAKVVDHLKNIHQALVLEKPTGIVMLYWPVHVDHMNSRSFEYCPTIAVINGHTFLLNHIKRDLTVCSG